MNSDLYYTLRPVIPRRMQIMLRRWRVGRQLWQNDHCWPIWPAAGVPPPSWPGWPDGKRFALVLMHDVESGAGASRCEQLARLEEDRGFRSTFAFAPLRYETPDGLRRALVDRGFEIMVHGLYHDGKDFRDRRTFDQRLGPINDFLRRWETRGFASASMFHNLPWISELDIDYDISTFDIDPFEPHPCQFGRIFPSWVQPPDNRRFGFVEMPYTLPQDFTLFVLMREQTNAIWLRKLDWIAEKGGMALVKTHPDYMFFGEGKSEMTRYPVGFYTNFLDYVRARYGEEVWLATPSEVARYWRGLTPADANSVIPFPGTLCASCRQSHAMGWFHHYRPAELR